MYWYIEEIYGTLNLDFFKHLRNLIPHKFSKCIKIYYGILRQNLEAEVRMTRSTCPSGLFPFTNCCNIGIDVEESVVAIYFP